MDVFLIPLGADRYELYCEAPADEAELDAGESGSQSGFIARLKLRFREMLAAAERDRTRPQSDAEVETGWFARIKARSLAWVVDAIAEQRLLWHLRKETEVRLFYPEDLSRAEAERISRQSLQRDADRHRNWLIVDALLLLISGLLVLVPGPNIIGYYFAFRVVGHYLSWRGAKQGLHVIQWQYEPCEPLAEVRPALTLAPVQRERRLSDIASRLRLDHLVTFLERIALRSA